MADGGPRRSAAKSAPEIAEPLPAIRERLLVIDDFLPAELAEAMRADIDAHFANPQQHKPETHQVWNYWFVRDLYTYLRTTPEKVIESVEKCLLRIAAGPVLPTTQPKTNHEVCFNTVG